ncbi:MlaC/ttg2D family ABC transporter substrate-binding protein [Sneathiella sp.]|jgi:phospholipid transport system substrate-binding protein|uniref:MlaC/ttg2D family ABC transporter substrate-binding protein n=1 Tax=Sneathiella sp. TaxID=1964365 RepID=UPI0039E2E10C
MTLRKLLVVSVAAFTLTVAPALVSPSFFSAHAEASSEKSATALVENLGKEAVTLLSNEKLDADAKRAGFDKLVSRDFDMNLIGRFVLGKHWRKASSEQKSEYQELFKRYIITTYQKRIGEYSGENLTILKAKPLNKNEYLVKSQIIRPKGPPIKLDWRVRTNKSGEQKIVDIVVENVSMALTHRDEFSSVISKNGGNVDGLISTLKKHIAAAES